MNILSLNIRGCGNSAKRKRLQHHIKNNNINVCLIQETKAQNIDDRIVHSIWGDKEVDWTTKFSEGLSGGILISWKTDYIRPYNSFSGEGFLGTATLWKSTPLYIVSVCQFFGTTF